MEKEPVGKESKDNKEELKEKEMDKISSGTTTLSMPESLRKLSAGMKIN